MKKACLLLLLPTAVMAQVIPTEEQKKDALMRAYHMNGDSMVRYGSIDLSTEPVPKSVKTEKVPTKNNFENRFLVPPPQKRTR